MFVLDNPFKIAGSDVPEDVDIIFVSDFFVTEITGGAELTSEALIESSPFRIHKLHSKNVTKDLLNRFSDKFWIFGNYAHMNLELIPEIVANLKYSILEYDYKYCAQRSPEKHALSAGSCDCHKQIHGKMISAFMYGSTSLWWMSEKQKDVYLRHFPFLSERSNVVLSSVFSESFFTTVRDLKYKSGNNERSETWGVLGSSSWVKGTAQAIEYCEKNDLKYEIIQGLKYDELLTKLSELKGLVFLPAGSDTCPRIVIEAKLLGCELVLNDNVQHKDESWFNAPAEEILSYLYVSREKFWSGIRDIILHKPTISGYTTTLNCVENQYPWKQSIQSMLEFCDEVIVVDGGSSDGTYEQLVEWKQAEKKLQVHQVSRDWNHPRFAVFDGAQKAEARRYCTMEYCWQQDADEVVHENDYAKIHRLIARFPQGVELLSLPVVEFWGNRGKVRMDVTPWKWRISKNTPTITHGVPAKLQAHDDEGHLYALPGTDGCDYINADTNEPVPHASFYTPQAHQARLAGLSGNASAVEAYSGWFQKIAEQLPTVYHYSWYDLERKIKTYKNYWSRHWLSLYNIEQDDTADNNMFFDKKWSEVSEKDIAELAAKLNDEMSGWVFHRKIDFTMPTPNMRIDITHPAVMRVFLKSD